MGNCVSTSMKPPIGQVHDFDDIMKHLCEDTEREIKFYRQIASEYRILLNSSEDKISTSSKFDALQSSVEKLLLDYVPLVMTKEEENKNSESKHNYPW